MKTLWGPYYFLPKKRQIVHRAAPPFVGARPMFVQYVLQVVWQVYEAGLHGDAQAKARVTKVLGLEVPARELNHPEGKVCVSGMMSHWLPMATALFSMVVAHLPSPAQAQPYRLPVFWSPPTPMAAGVEALAAAMDGCAADEDTPTVVYVSKMFAVHTNDLPGARSRAVAATQRVVPPRRRVADSVPKDQRDKPTPEPAPLEPVPVEPISVSISVSVEPISVPIPCALPAAVHDEHFIGFGRCACAYLLLHHHAPYCIYI